MTIVWQVRMWREHTHTCKSRGQRLDKVRKYALSSPSLVLATSSCSLPTLRHLPASIVFVIRIRRGKEMPNYVLYILYIFIFPTTPNRYFFIKPFIKYDFLNKREIMKFDNDFARTLQNKFNILITNTCGNIFLYGIPYPL